MTQPFPANLFLEGYMAPSGLESDAPDLIIEGELPADLCGTYYRNGPDPIHPPREGETYHWFHGDGKIECFDFSNGRVSWRNRWVQTEKYKLERAAGKSLYGVFGNPMTSDPSVAGIEYNTANTHIIDHGGRLLALMEGAPPVEISYKTLETVGNFDFDGATSGPFTAHPKFDSVSGEMMFFGYQANGPGSKEISYGVADKDGKLLKYEMIEAPFASMVHDFLVTATHVVFPIFPLTFSIERAIEQGLPMAWEPEKGTHFGVMPRMGTAADVRWYTMEARFMFHMINAWQEGDKLVADVCASNATQFAPMADGKLAPNGPETTTCLRQWTLDLASDNQVVREEVLDDMPCEFPRTDDRFMTRSYRHAYMVGGTEDGFGFNNLLHYDRQSGERKIFSGGKKLFGEPIVAPRKGSEDEADGYIIMLAFDPDTNLSELLVLDAQAIDKGPVAVAKLPLRIPSGFHGSWVAG
jgi:carotenoid cleavage dioxygenase-like enzyme